MDNSNNGYQRIGDDYFQEISINNQEDESCFLYGYKYNKTHSFLYHSISIILLGLPYILFSFIPKLKTLQYEKAPLNSAELILVIDTYQKYKFVPIRNDLLQLPNLGLVNLRYFIYRHTKFVWIQDSGEFDSVDKLLPEQTIDDYLNNHKGLSDHNFNELLKLHGPNQIKIEIKSYFTLFFEEVFNPFYLFQVFSVILWCVDDYVIYAGCVVVLTLFSSIMSLIQTRKQSEALHKLVESSKCSQVYVLRSNILGENSCLSIDPTEVVPGDLIVLPAGNFILPCDAILLTGQCIVNESVLTGESVPVTKTALHSSSDVFKVSENKKSILFSGTTLIQTRYYGGEQVLARVICTGFDTTKGALVKSILFPSPLGLEFYKDSFKFVLLLFTIAACGMAYCLYLYTRRHATIKDIVTRTLDIITIVVPPALPAAMEIGTVYSQNRLKRKGIFCISPPRINICGKVKLACFDKTGTLTRDCLEMNCVVPCENSQFCQPIVNVASCDIEGKLVQAMATCHSLTLIEGAVSGDPLDINMFEFTNWILDEPGENENERFDMLAPTVVYPRPISSSPDTEKPDLPYELGIIRQFTFSSTLQCMSVICKNLQSPNMVAFAKGAPEKLQKLCIPSTLPKDFSSRLSQFTAKGFRVIAIAYKELPSKFKWKEAQKVKRDFIECDLIFLGFLIMQNPLKEESAPIIKSLQMANIRPVMITGDNILTAVSVARDCGMVKATEEVYILSTESQGNEQMEPKLLLEKVGSSQRIDNLQFDLGSNYHLAVDGRTWNELRAYFPGLISSIIAKGTVFARFQPDQKTQLISSFQKIDYIVAMVGDGANDCGALKAAHVGISLSQAEASVAAPFTSSIPNISCLVHLILEGRCALVTSFAIFKYMALYSLIQFITILILYRCYSILGDFQFLFIDLIVTTVLAVTMGRQGPSKVLGTRRPMSSLVSPKNVVPLVLQIFTCATMQIGALWFLYQQNWFKPISPKVHEEVILSWENTVLFTVSCYQYIIIAIVYSKGKPFREHLLTNVWFIISAVILTVFSLWLMIYPCQKVADIMEVIYLKDAKPKEQFYFRLCLLSFPILHSLLAVAIESCLADRFWLKKVIQCLKCKNKPKNKYKLLLEDNSLETWFNAYNFSSTNNLQHTAINLR